MEDLVKNPGEVIGRPTEIIKKRVSIGSVKNETFGDFFGQEAKAVSLKYSDKKRLYSGNK